MGEHDFKSLTNHKDNELYATTVRRVASIRVESPEENVFQIWVEGENFLYKMVRNIVGMIVFAGRGKIKPEEIPSILESKDRKRAAVSAPAHGLTLIRQVFYQETRPNPPKEIRPR